MSQQYVVPNIYQDMSNQAQGYFAFRFVCQECGWAIDTMPIRSSVSTVTNVMDIGVGLLGGFWGRAAEAGEQIYGSRWHSEQADALQKSWAQIQHEFHLCPKCHRTVCNRCFNLKLNLCTQCAPDLKADGASFQHEMNIEAQRKQIQENYHAPQFNTEGIPSAVEPDMLAPSAQPSQPTPLPPSYMPSAMQQGQGQSPYNPSAAFTSTPAGALVMCPTCRRMGPPGKFCQDCGTKLPQLEAHCPQCSSKVEMGARFCPECGTKLQMAN
ncbi:MAG TPA: zinc ribbon domain-containing protein [Ktedonobacteraceae bacterium]|nr:zinc ribbon domain-containing protein [Ktedonobacteraceae bacterium]